ncbi:MAG: class I SAM-dependent methyltransferase [Myxococcales bacterium]|nr:class I SAM-dependent methyltransferase [Myxococcales bacterium]
MSVFYGELAPLWPLISPVEEYAEEAAFFAKVLLQRLRPGPRVMELGCGGGHNAFHLKKHFQLTLTDLSDAMLAQSALLNPECAHHRGDMRTLDLGRTFDAVFVHDAVDSMTTTDELAQAMATAFRHLAPGGLALFVPDVFLESFDPATESGGSDGADGRSVRYLEWTHPLEPGATSGFVDYGFLVREADGSARVFHDRQRFGVFPRSTWLELLVEEGFEAEVIPEETADDRPPRSLLLATRR